MKNRVVMFCTMPLVAPSQKNTCFDPSGHLKNGKCIFYVETGKILVAKVVGNAKMHISTKNRTMVPKTTRRISARRSYTTPDIFGNYSQSRSTTQQRMRMYAAMHIVELLS
jgi:hypothetical protein